MELGPKEGGAGWQSLRSLREGVNQREHDQWVTQPVQLMTAQHSFSFYEDTPYPYYAESNSQDPVVAHGFLTFILSSGG